MNASELKLALIRVISETNDLVLLKKLSELINLYESKDPKVYRFSEEQLTEINEAIEQYKNGNFMTEEEAENDIQQWFESEEVYVFNDWEQKRIDIALEQMKNGECISNEEAEKQIQKWFNEQEK